MTIKAAEPQNQLTASDAVDGALRLLNWLLPVVYGSNLVSSETGRVIGATFLMLLITSVSMTCIEKPRGKSWKTVRRCDRMMPLD